MAEKKIKVVWICAICNEMLRHSLPTSPNFIESIGARILGKNTSGKFRDAAQWNTNGIKELKKIPEIELHVIFPWRNKIKKGIYSFENEGIHYHTFLNEEFSFWGNIKRAFKGDNYPSSYIYNSRIINQIVDSINPDIVNLIGAENPYYSKSVLSLNPKYPLVVSLQTLMSEEGFISRYPISPMSYRFRSDIEKEIIKKADYITSGGEVYIDYIAKNIKTKAKLLKNIPLALAEETLPISSDKEYDFVYFANGIEKAFDLVVEAFGIVHIERPNVTLNVVGSYSEEFRTKMDNRLKELGCLQSVIYTGVLKTHEDVLKQISKSRFAVLPLKVDLISGTIRESIAMELPVVTTITPSTTKLNAQGNVVLLSDTGNNKALANNMLRLLNEQKLADEMVINGRKYLREVYPSNKVRMEKWVNLYKAIVNNNQLI